MAHIKHFSARVQASDIAVDDVLYLPNERTTVKVAYIVPGGQDGVAEDALYFGCHIIKAPSGQGGPGPGDQTGLYAYLWELVDLILNP